MLEVINSYSEDRLKVSSDLILSIRNKEFSNETTINKLNNESNNIYDDNNTNKKFKSNNVDIHDNEYSFS